VAQILFIIGAGLLGRFRLGDVEAEGPPVRAAGFMLMMPLLVTLLLSFMVGLMSGGDLEGSSGIMSFIFFLELPVMMICVGVAYMLIVQKTPGNIIPMRRASPPPTRKKEEEARSERSAKPAVEPAAAPDVEPEAQQEQPSQAASSPAVEEAPAADEPVEEIEEIEEIEQEPRLQNLPARPPSGRNFPNVMSTDQAARYLNISEQTVLDLINEGKLAAARINYRYQISRAVLDDFIRQRRTGSES
jgi:excisionase family DNA binding protein